MITYVFSTIRWNIIKFYFVPLLTLFFVGVIPVAVHAAVGSSCNASQPCPTGETCFMPQGGFFRCVEAANPSPTSNQNPYPSSSINNQNPSPTSNPGSTGSPGNSFVPSGPSITLINPLSGVDCSAGNGSCLSAFLLKILQFVIFIGSIVIVLMLVFIGYKFVAAQGSEGKIEEARRMLLWTVIGALVLLGAQAIAMGIQATVTALTSGG